MTLKALCKKSRSSQYKSTIASYLNEVYSYASGSRNYGAWYQSLDALYLDYAGAMCFLLEETDYVRSGMRQKVADQLKKLTEEKLKQK